MGINKVPKSVTPVPRVQAYKVMDQVYFTISGHLPASDYWSNSTAVKGVRTIRIRLRGAQSQAKVDGLLALVKPMLSKLGSGVVIYSNSSGYIQSPGGHSRYTKVAIKKYGVFIPKNANIKVWYISEPGKRLPDENKLYSLKQQ
jgi:hypothetical protein